MEWWRCLQEVVGVCNLWCTVGGQGSVIRGMQLEVVGWRLVVCICVLRVGVGGWGWRLVVCDS